MSSQKEQAPSRQPRHSAHSWRNVTVPPMLRGSDWQAHGTALQAATDLPVRSAAESMVHLLCEFGLDTFFGIPGGPIIPVFHAILSHPKARLIEPRHETGAAFMAMGYHRATGKIPVVVVTAGPGVTNVVTGVAAAYTERVPMIIICGDVPWAATGRRLLQDSGPEGISAEDMLRHMTRATIRIAHAGSAAGQVRAALHAATRPECPGPALVVASIDRAGSRAPALHLYSSPLADPARGVAPESALLRQVADLLRGAERPLLLLGSGCRDARDQVGRLIDALGVPFVTTVLTKGMIAEDHPLSLRNCGWAGSRWAHRYLSSPPDVTMVLGGDLNDTVTSPVPPVGPGGVLIHVDQDSAVIGRNLPTTIGAVCDVRGFVEALAAVVQYQGPPREPPEILRAIRAEPPFEVPRPGDDGSLPLAPHRLLIDLEKAAPGATFVVDMGEHVLFSLHYLTIADGSRFVAHFGLGSMGSGIGSAVGQALGDPGRRVVCICGDGGMQMQGMEILVAVKHRLPVVFAVFNDARYNMVYHGYRNTFGGEVPWDTPQIDFVRWAESLGAQGCRIDQPGQITQALLDRLTAEGLPVVLDIRYNAEIRVRSAGRDKVIEQMMGRD